MGPKVTGLPARQVRDDPMSTPGEPLFTSWEQPPPEGFSITFEELRWPVDHHQSCYGTRARKLTCPVRTFYGHHQCTNLRGRHAGVHTGPGNATIWCAVADGVVTIQQDSPQGP